MKGSTEGDSEFSCFAYFLRSFPFPIADFAWIDYAPIHQRPVLRYICLRDSLLPMSPDLQ